MPTPFERRPNTIQTASGRFVDPLNPLDPLNEYILEDVAHHLSQINRYQGASRLPISVAIHSLFVADIAADAFFDTANSTAREARVGVAKVFAYPEHVVELLALTHDVEEAYIGDIPTPIGARMLVQCGDGTHPFSYNKRVLREYVRRCLGLKFDPDAEWCVLVQKLVEQCDHEALRIESRLFAGDPKTWDVTPMEGVDASLRRDSNKKQWLRNLVRDLPYPQMAASRFVGVFKALFPSACKLVDPAAGQG